MFAACFYVYCCRLTFCMTLHNFTYLHFTPHQNLNLSILYHMELLLRPLVTLGNFF